MEKIKVDDNLLLSIGFVEEDPKSFNRTSLGNNAIGFFTNSQYGANFLIYVAKFMDENKKEYYYVGAKNPLDLNEKANTIDQLVHALVSYGQRYARNEMKRELVATLGLA